MAGVLTRLVRGSLGIADFVFIQLCFALSAVLIFINFLALQQTVPPEPLLIPIPATPGALLGDYLVEHLARRPR